MVAAIPKMLSLFLMSLFALGVQAQENIIDTTQSAEDSVLILSKETVDDSLHPKDFKRAILWASTLPGAGQAYNKKYWKICYMVSHAIVKTPIIVLWS